MSYIYVIKKDYIFKIGRSNNPKKRLVSLQTGSEFKLEIIFTIFTKFPKLLEKMLHKTFSEKHLLGEWFMLNDSDISKLNKLCIEFNTKTLSEIDVIKTDIENDNKKNKFVFPHYNKNFLKMSNTEKDAYLAKMECELASITEIEIMDFKNNSEVVSKARELFEYISLEEIKKIDVKELRSPQKYNRIIKHVRFHSEMKDVNVNDKQTIWVDGVNKEMPKHIFSNAVLKTFKMGNTYTTAEMKTLLGKIYAMMGVKYVNQKQAMELMTSFFNISETSRKVDGKKERVYKITSRAKCRFELKNKDMELQSVFETLTD